MADSNSRWSTAICVWAILAVIGLIAGSYLPLRTQFWVALPLAVISGMFCLALLVRA